MLRKNIKYMFSRAYSPVSLFQQRKLLYQYTSELLKQTNFLQKQQQRLLSIQDNWNKDGNMGSAKNNNINNDNKGNIISAYCGYDPTSDSLHLGNLVSIIMMARLHRLLKIRPIFLIGGATGLIGDPSGKKQQRNLLQQQKVQYNLQAISNQIKHVYDKLCADLDTNKQQYGLQLTTTNNDSKSQQQQAAQPLFINNYQFYKNMNVLTYLRDIGKVLRMNNLLGKQIVNNRLESEQGLSYTQFSYSILQAYDFYMLNKNYGCVLQFGGSDQWGNITNGCDLIKRLGNFQNNSKVRQGYGITMPLLLTKTGQKFGKTEGNALFLNPTKTPTSKIYDYLYNTSDDEIQKLLYIFTFFSPQKIQQLMTQHRVKPQLRLGQKILAQRVCKWVGQYRNIKQQLLKLTPDNLKKKTQKQMQEIYDCLPKQQKRTISMSQLIKQTQQLKLKQNRHIYLADLLVRLQINKSKNQARKDIQGEGIYINNSKLTKNFVQIPLTEIMDGQKYGFVLQGGYILFRRGKKKYCLLKLLP